MNKKPTKDAAQRMLRSYNFDMRIIIKRLLKRVIYFVCLFEESDTENRAAEW